MTLFLIPLVILFILFMLCFGGLLVKIIHILLKTFKQEGFSLDFLCECGIALMALLLFFFILMLAFYAFIIQ